MPFHGSRLTLHSAICTLHLGYHMAHVTDQLNTALADRYRIERELGQGGMALVYLATDLKHDRKVALKILRPELAAVIGAERFLNEIKVTANLQHPHILPLHDSGEASTFLYYVMPFIEGETLRGKLDKEKQLGVKEAIEITKHVASALDYAHRQGVIHRDIKPENVLLHDGQALVADFGIALAVSHAGGNRLTETGLSIGTPHYMSPEQAMGDRELDARSDVYSLGAMLYEMLTGEPPYTGATAQAIVARVITEEPRPLTSQRRTVPSHVAAAVHQALSKMPADRFATASEFATALENPAFTSSSVPSSTAGPVSSAVPPFRRSAVIGLAAFGILAAALAAWGWLRPAPPRAVSRFTVALPEGQNVANRFGYTIALAPAGDKLVYAGPGSGSPQLWLRPMDQLSATPIPGTSSPTSPFMAPDGQSVAFFGSGNRLQVVSLTGGPPVTLTDSATNFGGSWSRDGYLYFIQPSPFRLARIAATGGVPEVLADPDTSAFTWAWPVALPSGKGVLFTVVRADLAEYDIAVFDLDTREHRVLLRGTMARYASSGHIVYTRADGALLAAPFHERALELTGPSTPLIDGVVVKAGGASEITVAENGTIVYITGTQQDESLVWVERDGAERPVAEGLRGSFNTAKLSPREDRIAMSLMEEGNQDVWIYDLTQQTRSRLTFDDAVDDRPVWEPDGRWITFLSWRSDPRSLWRKPADGSGTAEPLIVTDRPIQEGYWSRDGRWLIVREGPSGDTQRDILYLEAGVDTVPRVFIKTQFDELTPALSPDSRWLAYVSNESGRDEVYVRPFPASGGRWQVSTDGGTEPRWAHEGREIFYRNGEGAVISAQVSAAGGSFVVGQRQRLFDGSGYDADRQTITYDVTRDGRRFLFIKQSGGSRDVVVVLNWFEELMRRAGR
jgi:Tol biopolymer transport system component